MVVAGFFAVTSCYYDVEELLYPVGECKTDNVSLQSQIVPILERSCYVCHGAGSNISGIPLEGYAALIEYVNNGKLLGSIRHESGFSAMPQNASKLIDCDIAKIEQWIADGALNN